jgi:hypothetical protein
MDNSNKREVKTMKNEGEELAERKSEATSKETLSDIARDEKIAGTKGSTDQTSVPSPDGTPDPDRSGGRADGSDTGGPM